MTKQIKTASGLILKWMNARGFQGLTTFTTIYLHPDSINDPEVLAHEMCHCQQMASLGYIRFSILYVYWYLKVGYWLNPFEIEAREYASTAVLPQPLINK